MVSFRFYQHYDESVASYRYRVKIPQEQLLQKGFEFSLEPDIAIFSKHFDPNTIETARLVKQSSKVAFDICDNHFQGEHGAYYKEMCGIADLIIASTPEMGKVIKMETGRGAVIIHDPYEYPQRLVEFNPHRPARLLWYGHASNALALERELQNLIGYCVQAIGGPLRGFPVTPWSPENMQLGFDEGDIVIIPVIENERTNVKGANRLIEAVRQGKFVVANHLPAYEQFKNMWIGDIKTGVEWALDHADEVPELVRMEQEYIHERFSPKTIGTQWQMALTSI